MSDAPRDDLYRAMQGGITSDDGKTLTIRLAPHDQWAEIQSVTEGHFLERFSRSAYRKTMAEHPPKILFNHGHDPEIGEKVIATTDEVGEDATSPYARGRLLDGVPELVADGIRAGVYGASHRFSVVREKWDDEPIGGAHNPKKLRERTLTAAQLYELGPVTWPAYAQASASLRSMTDEMRSPTPPPVAPSDDAGPPPTSPERRDEPVTIAAIEPTRSSNMDGPILSIEDKRARVTELNDGLARMAESISGPLPEEEQVRWNTDVDERDRLAADIAAYDTRQAQLVVAARIESGVERPWEKPVSRNIVIRKSEAELHSPETRATSFEGAMAEYRDDAMHLLEKTKFAYGIADQTKSADKVADLLDNHDSPSKELARRIKYTSAPAYASAFHKFITSRGSTIGFTAEEQRGTALAVGVDGTGGFTVPYAFDPTIIAVGAWTGAINPYRRVCRVVPIVGTDTWNALTSAVITATRTTEAAAAIEQGPAFLQPQYVVTRVQGQITASFEMFQDRADLASELGTLIQEAKDNEEESSMATGATAAANIGVGPVSGTSGAYTAVAGGGSGVIAALDANLTEAALPVRHRFGAQWFMNRSNIRKFQAVETAGGILFGGSSYQAVGNVDTSSEGNTGLRLLGYPVNESPSLPVATTTTITAGTLLQPQSYVIVDRIGMSVQFIPFILNSSALATGQQALYFMYRNTAKPINVDAGRTLRFL